MEKINKPEIRFNGFREAWVHYSLKSITDSIDYGLNAASKSFDGTNKYLRITDIDDVTREFLKNDITSPNLDLTNYNNFLLQAGDVLFARTGASVGKSYIYKEKDGKVYYAGFLIRARIRKEINSELVFQYSLTDRYNKYIRITSQRSGQPGVNAQEYGDFSLHLPKNDAEQKLIGNFFENIDKLISEHQQKHAKLKSIKQAMLDKMFPKQGQLIPEIRFKGFEGDWIKDNLGELTFVYDGTHQTPKYKESGIMFLSVENIKNLKSNKFISQKAFEEEFNNYPENGDVLMTRIGDVGTANIVETDEPIAYYVSLALLKKKKLDSYFLKESIASEQVRLDIWRRTLHIAFPKKINKNEIEKVQISFPISEEEQKMIGDFFKQISQLISLHLTEIEKLQNIKKAFLAKMFI